MLCQAARPQNGEYRDIAHPINSGARDMIQTVILNKYERELLENGAAEASGQR